MNKYYRKSPGPKRKSTDAGFSEEVQDQILGWVSDEFAVAKRNLDEYRDAFNEYYNMLHCIRDKKPNDWESDIYLPEFVSRVQAHIGNFVRQYFSSKDYVEPDIQSDEPQDIAEGKAAKILLNTLLNDRRAHYYHKVVRLLMFVFTYGYGIIKGCYRQRVEQREVGTRMRQEHATDEMGRPLAEDGDVFADPYSQRPMFSEVPEPITQEVVLEDRPEFDVYPVQHVYISPEYQYSLQEKEYVIFESMKTLDELYADQENNGYFNLHLLENMESDVTPIADESYAKLHNIEETDKPVSPRYIILERWGKFPIVVKERDENGKIVDWEPGIDKDGEAKKNAENVECIVTTVRGGVSPSADILIRYQPSPYSKRPMVRFLCYVDPLFDGGFGDGEMVREVQRAINDNYNLMNYRTKLSITPGFKAKRFAGIPDNVRVTPEKAIMVENMEDLEEFKIEDNIQGGLHHQNLLSSRMDFAMATNPQIMGVSPEPRETATQATLIDDRASTRLSMKSTNLEFIGFTEFYDMLLTMVNDFMLPPTLENILGRHVQHYNPNRQDKFKPVSQALDSEESKQFKIKMWDQVLGRVAAIPNPKTPAVVNYIIGQVLELMGGDFKHFKRFMFEEDPRSLMLYQLVTGSANPPIAGPGQPGTGAGPPKPGQAKRQNPPRSGSPSNQYGFPQSPREQATRASISARRG